MWRAVVPLTIACPLVLGLWQCQQIMMATKKETLVVFDGRTNACGASKCKGRSCPKGCGYCSVWHVFVVFTTLSFRAFHTWCTTRRLLTSPFIIPDTYAAGCSKLFFTQFSVVWLVLTINCEVS
uniref:Putative secreted protein n=1 Tax=Amblyomma triste TaxID=251400 RepID=A0A023G1X7_AMBTT